MTVILGVLCRDGAVIGSDGASSATRSSRSSGREISYERAKQKVGILSSEALGATAGRAAVGQRMKFGVDKFFIALDKEPSDSCALRASLRKRILEELEDCGREPSDNDSILVNIPYQGQQILMSMKGKNLEPCTVEEDLFYTAIGSGAKLAEPFFEFRRGTFWYEKLPTVSEAKIGVAWTLQHTVDTSSRGVSFPLNIALREVGGIPRLLERKEIEEALETVRRMQNKLREYMQETQSELAGTREEPPSY